MLKFNPLQSRLGRAMFSAVLVTIAFLGSAAGAAEPAPLSLVVHSGDLDLRTKAGADELQARVDAAARSVCRERDPMLNAVDRRCWLIVTDRARPKVEHVIAMAARPKALAQANSGVRAVD